MICYCCSNDLNDDLIDVEILVKNGNNDPDDELDNYDFKTISVCCICVAHNRFKEMQ